MISRWGATRDVVRRVSTRPLAGILVRHGFVSVSLPSWHVGGFRVDPVLGYDDDRLRLMDTFMQSPV